MRYVLDTNICIYLIKKKPARVMARFDELTVGDVGVSSVTVAELQFGVHKSRYPERNRRALEQFLLPLEIAAFGDRAAEAYGMVRAALERRGTPIGALDTLIAAHALSLEATLVTNNVSEFARVPGLQIDGWVE